MNSAYALYTVERNEDDKVLAFEQIGVELYTTLDAALDACEGMTNPYLEIATMTRGLNVWTPAFA